MWADLSLSLSVGDGISGKAECIMGKGDVRRKAVAYRGLELAWLEPEEAEGRTEGRLICRVLDCKGDSEYLWWNGQATCRVLVNQQECAREWTVGKNHGAVRMELCVRTEPKSISYNREKGCRETGKVLKKKSRFHSMFNQMWWGRAKVITKWFIVGTGESESALKNQVSRNQFLVKFDFRNVACSAAKVPRCYSLLVFVL